MVPKKVLLCADFSDNSLPAKETSIQYARAFEAELLVLHVVNSSRLGFPAFEMGAPFDIQQVLQAIEESESKSLGEIAEECKDLNKVTTFSRMGVPAIEIVRLAGEESVDLIVMGTHGWTGIRHLIVGSTAENVVRSATCSVLVVRSEPKSE
jgi:universal stress protein A